ncbi:C4-dicarboxylate ABC transporter permease [Psychromonas sp. MB-3u-54]|uniref:TRAP transporter large permease n=1 Tax=Psychromonas sp. MB-3u-54 TaxID=2058319 RepID=UPI000C328E33|nr:TRAP transporter large permease [Psychromonas sp. MB-3u-54]PKH02335.1 C4-dicarboxylate ABC transporter permease [Psychromonas sp. MB-3u-54]
MTSFILFFSFALLVAVGVPIGMALGSASILSILNLPFLSINFYTQGLVSGLDSFPLIAILLFTLAANIMSHGGISGRLLALCQSVFGHLTGGLGVVAITSCIFFASISGTGSATVAAIGLTMIPMMVKNGYDKAYSGAMIATAGGIGVIIPPSVVMIVYAIVSGQSVSKMFMAGVIPGILVGLFLLGYNYIQSKKHSYKGLDNKATWNERWNAFKYAKEALLLPVIILGGIYSGLFTPTESAAVAVAYGIVLSMLYYKELTLKGLAKITLESALLVATVLVIVGASVSFGRILTIERIPLMITDFILNLTDNKILILLAINILLLIIGTFLETLAAIVILTPILLPVVTSVGMDPVHFGIVMVVNLAIGFVTPPLGANLFMASQVGKIPFEDLSRAVLGWIMTMIAALLLITFIPGISLWLPNIMS